MLARPPAPARDSSGARRLAWGYAGGLFLGALASWVRVAITGTLRIDTKVPAFFIASALLGVGLGVASLSAIRLVKAAADLPRGALLRWAMLGNLVVAFAAPLTSSDIYHYLAAGRLQLLGKNPFAVPATALGADPLLELVTPRWAQNATPYGPLTNLFFRAAAHAGALGGSPFWGSAITFKLMMVACHLVFLRLAARTLRAHRPSGDGARTLAIVAFSPIIAWEVSGQAHNDGILIVALMLFVAAAVEGRELAAVLAIAAGTYAKVTLAPILALYLLYLLRTRGARAVLHGLAALLLGFLLVLPFVRGFRGLGPTVAIINGSAISHSLGDFFYNVLAPLGPSAQEHGVKVSLYLCLLVCAVAFGNALRARTAPALLRGAFLFLLAWDMTIPLFQTWYVCWLFPFAVVETDARWQRLIGVYGIWSAMEWAAPIDPFTTMAVNGYVVWQAIKLLRSGGLAVPEVPAHAVVGGDAS